LIPGPKTKQIIEKIWHLGDSVCAVYLVDTGNDAGLVLIDAGMDLEMIRGIDIDGLGFEDIRHCILIHCHIDHSDVCSRLSRELLEIRFYAHALDSAPLKNTDTTDRRTAFRLTYYASFVSFMHKGGVP
jgi:glyoxylase-like metal-dependent hydrolase (beta-lactamase superfamily II)